VSLFGAVQFYHSWCSKTREAGEGMTEEEEGAAAEEEEEAAAEEEEEAAGGMGPVAALGDLGRAPGELQKTMNNEYGFALLVLCRKYIVRSNMYINTKEKSGPCVVVFAVFHPSLDDHCCVLWPLVLG
jgi:hypothetical protein